MCKILISINPEYVNKIFSGEKIYEFRKIKAKYKPDKIIIYCTAPVSAVVGEAAVTDILSESPNDLWSITRHEGGVNEEFFFKYFKNKSIAIAYKLDKIIKYDKKIPLSEYGINFAPQSFVYL
ncbi:putative transcriptional regulator [Bacilli bacterium PM5-3]|nr:putative transcriptional regulator [Bacilli bacterium PM5-3]MDH6603590.1 putative transcriptional regulator [Bacilli bacterium PM5-9]